MIITKKNNHDKNLKYPLLTKQMITNINGSSPPNTETII